MAGGFCFTNWELMIEKMLAAEALIKAKIIPLVYWDSNLKINTIPAIIISPAKISNRDIFLLVTKGSKMAVNKVVADRQTSVTETVEIFIA